MKSNRITLKYRNRVRINRSVLLFLLAFIFWGNSANAQEPLSKKSIELVMLDGWTKYPTSAEINSAYNAYVNKAYDNCSVSSWKKMYAPWSSDPLNANKIVLINTCTYSSGPLSEIKYVALLKQDLISGGFKFEGQMIPHKRPGEPSNSTATYLQAMDLVYLKAGWIQAKPTTSSDRPTSQPSGSTQSDGNGYDDDQDESDDLPWTIIVGGVVGAALVAAIRKRLKTSKEAKASNEVNGKKKGKEKKKEEDAHYILELNQDKFKLNYGESQELVVSVRKITASQNRIIPAAIQISNSEKALNVSPKKGKSTLTSILKMTGQAQQPSFDIIVTAQTSDSQVRKAIKITTENDYKILFETEPDNKRSLRPNIDRLITCKARVVNAKGEVIDKLTQKIQFIPQSDWIDKSEQVYSEEWQKINIGASDPDANAAVSHPPAYVTLRAEVKKDAENEFEISDKLDINLLDCKLDTNAEELTFPVTGEQEERVFLAFIEDCGGESKWKFKASYKSDDNKAVEPLSTISLDQINDTKVEITLRGPTELPTGKNQYLRRKLVIEAQEKEEDPLERHIYVNVTKVGLYLVEGVDKEDNLSFEADGEFKKALEFELYRYNEKTEEIEVDEVGLKKLRFELESDQKEDKNIYSVIDPQYEFDTLCTNIPRGRYSFISKGEIPGYGDEISLKVKAMAPVPDGAEQPELFEKIFTLKVKTLNTGKRYPTWEEAYKDCKYIINEYVPKGPPRDKLNELLEKRKHVLDAEGLTELRKQMWSIAYNLILAEGAEGYKAVDAWASRITTTLEWMEWAGDLAYSALASYYLKGLGATAATLTKSYVVEAIQFYIYERELGWGEFKRRQIDKVIPFLMSSAKGRLFSLDNIEMVVGKNKAVCWAVYASVQFSYHLYNTGSIMQAAKLTAKEMRDEFLISFLSKELRKRGSASQTSTANTNPAKKSKVSNSKDPKSPKVAKGNQANKTGKAQSKNKSQTDDYVESVKDADVSGYTKQSQKHLSKVAKEQNVTILTRPTTKHAKHLLETNQAVPKKAFVKNKTINETDTLIGASESDLGKVGSFNPKLDVKKFNKLPEKVKAKVLKRYKQRKAEYRDQKQHIEDNSDKLYVKKGVIHDRLTGKPYTGDIDIFDIRGPNGERLPKAKVEKVIAELRKHHSTSSVEHGAHLDWDLDSIKDPEDRRIAQGIYDTIVSSHKQGGEALVEFGPDSSSTGPKAKGVYHKGSEGVIHL